MRYRSSLVHFIQGLVYALATDEIGTDEGKLYTHALKDQLGLEADLEKFSGFVTDTTNGTRAFPRYRKLIPIEDWEEILEYIHRRYEADGFKASCGFQTRDFVSWLIDTAATMLLETG